MGRRDFHKVIAAILQDDKRYAVGAYIFVRMALDFAAKKVNAQKPLSEKKNNHITARELLFGAKDFALETFGPMAAVLFKDWGVHTTADIGQLIFNMIKVGEMSKSPDDKIEDFENVYDFYEAFEKPYLPKSKA